MKTVLITGGNKGIGFETAKQLGELGYKVYIGCRTKS
ncbi:MAG: SDR family NAD(P)-dependent oxidoreductase, partial [Flavobacteriales bacterium]